MEVWELRHRSRNDHTYCHSQRLTGSLVLPVSATGDFAALGLLFLKGSLLLPGGTTRNPMNYKLSLLPVHVDWASCVWGPAGKKRSRHVDR